MVFKIYKFPVNMQSQQPLKMFSFFFYTLFYFGFLLLLRISKNKIRKFNNTTGDHCITLFQFFVCLYRYCFSSGLSL